METPTGEYSQELGEPLVGGVSHDKLKTHCNHLNVPDHFHVLSTIEGLKAEHVGHDIKVIMQKSQPESSINTTVHSQVPISPVVPKNANDRGGEDIGKVANWVEQYTPGHN